jgi:hypothetical protein
MRSNRVSQLQLTRSRRGAISEAIDWRLPSHVLGLQTVTNMSLTATICEFPPISGRWELQMRPEAGNTEKAKFYFKRGGG